MLRTHGSNACPPHRLQNVRESLMCDKEAFQSVVVRTLDIVTNHKQTVQGFIAAYRTAVATATADTANM